MSTLVFWSIVTIFIRAIAIALFALVSYLQYQQFKYKNQLQPLKRILFYVPIALVVTNIPQGLLSWDRITGVKAPDALTALASVSNGSGLLITAILFLLIYTFKD